MSVVTINKDTWVELVSNTTAKFTAQTRASHGFEVFIGDALPGPTVPGVAVPPGTQHAASRSLGDGKVYGKVPQFAPYDTAGVVIIP